MITLTAKIYISETEIIEIDRRNMLSIGSSIFDRSDLRLPSFGIISNTGNIEFNDSDGRVLQYAENLQLQAGQKCEIWLTNTLVEGATQLVATMKTDQWDYDNNSRTVSVSIKDDLEELQDINFDGIPYQIFTTEKAFSVLYNELHKKTNGSYPMQSLEELDEKTRNVLKTTFLEYPILNKGSLWQQWTKLCQACQLHIYKNCDGIIVCRYNGGN